MSTLIGLIDNLIRDMEHLRGVAGPWILDTGHSLIILGTLWDDTLDDNPFPVNRVVWPSAVREVYCLVEVDECM